MYQYAMPVQVVHARLPVFSAYQMNEGLFCNPPLVSISWI
jgi:hypothetical protein